LVFGALGILTYLLHLADEVFHGSVYFPIVLSIIGVAVIYLGAKYQANRKELSRGTLAPAILQVFRRLAGLWARRYRWRCRFTSPWQAASTTVATSRLPPQFTRNGSSTMYFSPPSTPNGR